MSKNLPEYRAQAIAIIEESTKEGKPIAPFANLNTPGSVDVFPYKQAHSQDLDNSTNGPFNPDSDVIFIDPKSKAFVRYRFT